jgi:voltage-gated potassium channel
LLKLGRYTYAMNLLKRALFNVKEVMAIAFLVLVVLLIFSSSLMFYIEHDAQPVIFSSIPDTMWWAIATLTTVGYGDAYPITPLGKFLGSFVAIIGIGMFAIPTGVLATAFIEEIRKNSTKVECKESTFLTPEETVTLLERLDKLHDKGVITEEEFQVQKERVLKR